MDHFVEWIILYCVHLSLYTVPGPTKSHPEPSGHRPDATRSRPDAARSRPDAARVCRDSNLCMTVPIPPAAPGLSVVTVGWLLELSFKKPYKMRSLMA